jgi:hypothetical protein
MIKQIRPNFPNLIVSHHIMFREEIISELKSNYQDFTGYLLSLEENEFMYAAVGKWTAGQQMEHLIRSIKPLNTALKLPSFLLKIIFGKSNRPSKDFDSLVARYKSKLVAGGQASGRFLPAPVDFARRTMLARNLFQLVERLCLIIRSYNEDQLDRLILPHPLLGKVTIREMLYFTIYHAEHHKNNTARNLEIYHLLTPSIH